MGRSLKLFSVRGIEIRLHITFPLILLWAGLQYGMLAGNFSGAVFGVIAISFLFILVTLHELGHSFVAQYFNVDVERIVLSPIGGVAQLKRMPDKPVQELLIAIGGPAVNLIIGAIMTVFAIYLGVNLLDPSILLLNGTTPGLSTLFSFIFLYNIILFGFNLLPAFPMDGGRILRALLAMRLDYARATAIAGNIGRGLAILMGFYGLFAGGIFMVVIAIFIFTAASYEMRTASIQGHLRGFKAKDIYSPSAYCLSPFSSLQQAATLMLSTGQSDFAICQGEEVIGFLPKKDFTTALRTKSASIPVNSVMREDITPVSPEDDLVHVHQLFMEKQVDSLPVVEDGRYIGLITRGQIGRLYQNRKIAPKILLEGRSA